MKQNKNVLVKAIIAIVLIVFVFSSASCSGRTAYSNYGWPGATVDGDTVYVASSGKLAALQKSNGAVIWQREIKDTATAGGLSCGSGSSSSVIYANPVVDNGIVYLGTYSGKIMAYNTINGNILWEYPSEGYIKGIIGNLIIDNGIIYLGSAAGVVIALDIATQGVIWSFDTEDILWASPCLNGDTLFIASYDKKLWAIDINTGAKKWEQPFETDGPIVATPVYDNGVVYIGSLDRGIYAIDADTGALNWKFTADSDVDNTPKNWFWSTPVISDGVIYAPNMDGYVYMLQADSGALVAAVDLDYPISSSPVLLDGKIVVATQHGNIYTISKVNQTKMLLKSLEFTVQSALCVDDEIIYVHTLQDEVLYAVNGNSGVSVWNYTIN